jgi:uncharacterized protein (TIGR02145 family)
MRPTAFLSSALVGTLDRNIGATKVAADVGTADASTVDNCNAYGEYYTFDKSICPTGFSVPTKEELVHFAAVFKGFVGNRKIGEFLLVAQW